MNTKKRIEKFNRENKPFYLVDLGERYSLCLLLGGTPMATVEYGQYAYNYYAEVVGKPVEVDGWLTYGDGYDWEYVFKKAFENDPSISKLNFDCESSGFFCDCADLSVIESFGRRFRDICENREEFIKLVETAMCEAETKLHSESEDYEENMLSVRMLVEQNPNNAIKMLTPMGYISVDPDQASGLLNGEPVIAYLGTRRVETMVNAEDLLSLPVNFWRIEKSPEGDTCYMMVDLPPIEEEQGPSISM